MEEVAQKVSPWEVEVGLGGYHEVVEGEHQEALVPEVVVVAVALGFC